LNLGAVTPGAFSADAKRAGSAKTSTNAIARKFHDLSVSRQDNREESRRRYAIDAAPREEESAPREPRDGPP